MSEEKKPPVVEGVELTLSTGVVLRAHKANPMTLIKIMAQEPEPKPPTVYMEVMGREVENYQDPAYLERLEGWRNRYHSRLLDAMIGLGTDVVTVPKGFPKVEDDSWVRKLKVYGIDVSMASEPDWRKINWITNIACKDETDLSLLQKKIQELSGVSEEDVAEATKFSGSDKADR